MAFCRATRGLARMPSNVHAAAYIVAYDRRHGSDTIREVIFVIICVDIFDVLDFFRWNLREHCQRRGKQQALST